MKTYVGIDLGTTNSAISTFDGTDVRLYKSPEQNDVTPSAIFIDRRGNKLVGQRAYNNAARSPKNSATGFKRLMGTSTPIKLAAVDVVMTPEECSAEILRILYGYLPEDIRNNPDTGTVITVPAAFNQMQKDATMVAAESAGLGKVALMQEPVAAVMSVMRQRKTDGTFLVFDLGGGTLDVAIAQSTSGRVSLLAHGGIAMCGGRDFDLLLMNNVVKPWLLTNFDLPEDFIIHDEFSTLRHMASYAAERAKIDLSAKDEAIVSLDDTELKVKDRSGADIYLDIPIDRKTFDALIDSKVQEAIGSARETMEKAGLTAHDIERIVFVGGPTQYKPLRDKVAFELGISESTYVNPMTAVSEGAAVFAESIDWSSTQRGRKSGRGTVAASGALNIGFAYTSRTPDTRSKIVAKIGGKPAEGSSFQIDSIDTGTTSGRVTLKDGASIDVTLSKPGENLFKIYVFDPAGGPITISENKITITRTAAQIDAIPASHSIGVEAREKLSGPFILRHLVKEGESLPKTGRATFRSDEMLKAGSPNSIRFKLWEGSIESPVTDNRFIGVFEIRGSDFSDGVIAKGAELLLDYQVLDSGNIELEITVPSIGGSFNCGRNFYSRDIGQIDFSNASKRIEEESFELSSRIDDIASKVNDPRLDQARDRLARAPSPDQIAANPESASQAMSDIQEAKKLLALASKDNQKLIRQMELDSCVQFFENVVRKHARPIESTAFDKLAAAAQGAIDNNKGDFENHIREIRGKNWDILFNQDWFIIDRFNGIAKSPHQFFDAKEFQDLIMVGKQALSMNDIDKLRQVVNHLESVRMRIGGDNGILSNSNILVG